jgi:predicted amidophosphoribosyltransferase
MIHATSMGDFAVDYAANYAYEWSDERVCPRCKKPIQNDSRTCSDCCNYIRGRARVAVNRAKAGELSGNLDEPAIFCRRRVHADDEANDHS